MKLQQLLAHCQLQAIFSIAMLYCGKVILVHVLGDASAVDFWKTE